MCPQFVQTSTNTFVLLRRLCVVSNGLKTVKKLSKVTNAQGKANSQGARGRQRRQRKTAKLDASWLLSFYITALSLFCDYRAGPTWSNTRPS